MNPSWNHLISQGSDCSGCQSGQTRVMKTVRPLLTLFDLSFWQRMRKHIDRQSLRELGTGKNWALNHFSFTMRTMRWLV